jgi:competence protein ComFC
METFILIFDLIFPHRENDAAFAGLSPADFYEKVPRWQGEIYPSMGGIFHYQDPTAKAMVKELKSSRNRRAAKIAAHAFMNYFKENKIKDAIIVPMPISKKRRKKRGYNQCELILDLLKKEECFDFEVRTDMLKRPVDTAKLALENRLVRIKSVEGIFRASLSLYHIEKRILVIDDVITTGSTMREAMATLKKAGAKNVAGLGLAH